MPATPSSTTPASGTAPPRHGGLPTTHRLVRDPPRLSESAAKDLQTSVGGELTHSCSGIGQGASRRVWPIRRGADVPTTVEAIRGSRSENGSAAAASGTDGDHRQP